MSDLKSYLVEFDSKRNIKDKIYSNDCQVKDIDCQFVIVIIYNEYMFFANNRKSHGQNRKRDIFHYLKEKKKGIIISDFFYFFFRLSYFVFLKKNKIKLLNIMVF